MPRCARFPKTMLSGKQGTKTMLSGEVVRLRSRRGEKVLLWNGSSSDARTRSMTSYLHLSGYVVRATLS